MSLHLSTSPPHTRPASNFWGLFVSLTSRGMMLCRHYIKHYVAYALSSSCLAWPQDHCLPGAPLLSPPHRGSRGFILTGTLHISKHMPEPNLRRISGMRNWKSETACQFQASGKSEDIMYMSEVSHPLVIRQI